MFVLWERLLGMKKAVLVCWKVGEKLLLEVPAFAVSGESEERKRTLLEMREQRLIRGHTSTTGGR